VKNVTKPFLYRAMHTDREVYVTTRCLSIRHKTVFYRND